jgi:hypothetical protein
MGYFNTTGPGQQGVKFKNTGVLQIGSVAGLSDVGTATYGGMSVTGYKNGYSGFNFPNSTDIPSFIVRDDGLHGVFFQGLSQWAWYHDKPNAQFKVTDQIVAGNGVIYGDNSFASGHWYPSTKDTNYTFSLLDRGRLIIHTSGSTHTYTIPTNASVPFQIGTRIGIVCQNGAGYVTVSPSVGVTLRNVSSGSSGNRTVSADVLAFLTKVSTDLWYIEGAGVT